ncbi:NACHT domain-containing protein [Streptomyces sp. NPDC048718]|uniref:NACHT domain-containing protein n=1 Tax=Streptomyces sp. NPDC048718 TaxID=3365587 RepID=UPI00371C9A5B
MDPAVVGSRLASAAIGPLLKKLLVGNVPGAGLPGSARGIRLSGLVTFRGEKRTLTEKDVRKLAATLVERAAAGPGERPFPADETEAVTEALAATLLSLGDLDMDDVQAVHLGHEALAARLRAAAPAPDGLADSSVLFLDAVTGAACRHILEFFTQRPGFVARTLVEQTRAQAALAAKTDAVLDRLPHPDVRDAAFERRYLKHLAAKHGRLTIYGIDLYRSEAEWPLDMAYLSLEATGSGEAEPEQPRAGEGFDLRNAVHPAVRSLRADHALARHDRILLRGQAGSGKTTLSQWLTLAAAAEEPVEGMTYLRGRIPFVLPLRTLTRHGERLPAAADFLSAAGSPLSAPDGWVDRVLAAGRGLVLVDGIDEIPEAERGRARTWLRDLLAAYGDGNRWLVTSRPTAVRDDWLTPDGFTELTLSPMTRAEVATFVRRWHRAAGPDAAAYEQPLLDALRANEDVGLLATNPLMCGLICALHRDRRGFLPRGRKALYEAALSMLLERRDRERDMGSPTGVELSEDSQIRLIQRLAHWLTVNGRTQIDRERAMTIVADAVPSIPEAYACGDPDTVFTHLLHRSGLLREPTADTVEFVHRTFQDFLAAKHLVERWDIGLLVGHAGDDQWEDVIRMAVGHARPRECDELLRELLEVADSADDRATQLRILVVAATALDHATEVSPDVREDILARTAEVIPPRSPDEARALAAGGRAVLHLLGGPDDLDPKDALHSVITASHIVADAVLPYLARFADHPDLSVRSQLVWAWSRFDAREYAEEVVARLDPAYLRYSVPGDEHADELLRLGLRPDWLEIGEEVSEEALARLLTACDPVSLRLRRRDKQPSFAALAGLTRLSSLTIALTATTAWSAADLPTGAPLVGLTLPAAWPQEGLGYLTRLERLDTLNLGQAPVLNAAAWIQLADLTQVSSLVIDSSDLALCPDDITLDHVRAVHLAHAGHPGLDRLVLIFPELVTLSLTARSGETADVATLTELPELRLLEANAELTGTERLPPTVEVVTF